MKNMSRRNFVKGAAAAGATVALAACSSDTEDTSSDDTSSDDSSSDDSTEEESSSVRKVLRFGQSNAKLGLDMQQSTNSGSSSIADSIFEAPLRWTEENELVTCLLTEIPEFEDDGVTLHCTLKEGILFHDGTELTASDVKYSFERMFKPDTIGKSTYMYDMILGADEMMDGEADELEGLTVEDDYNFTFTLTSPNATFVKNLGISYAHIFPEAACEAAGDDWGWGTNCIGTGKYQIVENDDTTEVILQKFEDYHDGEPALDEVQYIFYDDTTTKMLAYKNGDIDYCDLASDLLSTYQQDSEVSEQITLYETLGTHFVNLNLSEDMGLTDVNLRKALSTSIDRETLVSTVLSGAGTAATGFLAPQTPGYNADATLDYDVEGATALVEEAGASGTSLSCVIRTGVYETYMTVIQAYWSEIGINMSLTTEDSGVWSSDWADGNLQLTALGWFPLYADGDNHMYTYFHSSNASAKSSFYDSEEFDALVEAARASLDEDERADLYMQADTLLVHEDYATIPLYWPKNSFVAKPYVLNAAVGNLIYHMFDIDIDTTNEDYSAE